MSTDVTPEAPPPRGSARGMGRMARQAARLAEEGRPDAASRLSGEDRLRMIAEAAYYRAELRGFAPGRELEDWLAAEIEVEALFEDTDRDH